MDRPEFQSVPRLPPPEGDGRHSSVRPRFRGLGLSARLALGFGIVGLLFLLGNYLSQRNAKEVAERIGNSTETSRRVDAVARDLLDALADYQRSVLGIGNSSTHADASKSQHDAEVELADAVARYAALNNPIPGSLSAETLDQSVKHLQENVQVLAADARRMDDPLNRYWERFDKLQKDLGELDTGGWQIGDRIVVPRTSISIIDALLDVRRAVSAYLASPNDARAEEVAFLERVFISLLDQNTDSLIKSQGEPWLKKVRADFTQLRQGLRIVGLTRDRIERRSIDTTAGIQDLANLVRTGISEPASRALAESANDAAAAAHYTNQQLKIASAAILGLIITIALLTVASVTGPIRRLMGATRMLAAGDESARALRGGMRELDQLAAAFNEMADGLSTARHQMRSHQAQLEERVSERTQQLQHLAYHDSLTQLPNRRHLFQHLTEKLEQARVTHRRVALMLLDLDNFKTLNDSLGHLFGDRVLKAVSERLVNAVGPHGFAARLGGDEFTIVFDTGVDVAHQAEVLLSQFQTPMHVDDREIIVSISIGTGIYPDHASDAESLLRAADAALFKAKEFGRNRACVASAALVEQIGGQFKTEQALRRATNFNEFVLMFQPQLSLPDGRVNAVEALVRWRRGDVHVSPMDFLPMAEQSGLITEITDWVLKEAVTTLAYWRRGPWPQARVAVNISAQQFMDQAFVPKLQSLLLLHGVPPSSLELELTETALQSGNATVKSLRELRNLGVGIALDDFGAGYSSLASLEQLSLSRVKIDRSLIANVDQEPRSKSIARSIIDLCRSLNLEVTVEGIERREQFHFLRQCESVDVQGYLFARPLAAEEVLEACSALPLRVRQLTEEDEAIDPLPASASILRWRTPPRPR